MRVSRLGCRHRPHRLGPRRRRAWPRRCPRRRAGRRAGRSPARPARSSPRDNWWHADVSDLPVHRAQPAVALAHVDRGRPAPRLRAVVRRRAQLRHPDHGRAAVSTARCGCGSATRARATRCATRSAATPGSRAAAAPTATGTRSSSTRRSCRLYETFATRKRNGRWTAGSGAVWSLRSNALRPDGWTSADAAGLPILPGPAAVERGDAAAASTTRSGSPPTSPATHHLWPARHDAGSRRQSLAYPPMGARFRLKAGFSTRGYSARTPGGDPGDEEATAWSSPTTARRGSSRASRTRHWPTRLIEDLKQIPASAFVAVDTSSLKVSRQRQVAAASRVPVAVARAFSGTRPGFRMRPAAVVFTRPSVVTTTAFGLWRSLVAHLTGGQGVAGSNPVSPTE